MFIKRNLVLKEMELKHDPQGKPVIFSIKFIKANGEIVYLPKAISCGLRANMKANRLRGVMPVDAKADQTSHIYPVHIDFIVEFNGWRVQI
jgi:hypothetical protein